jgi:beta-lactamase superfamily II metal-dependent hydrolase
MYKIKLIKNQIVRLVYHRRIPQVAAVFGALLCVFIAYSFSAIGPHTCVECLEVDVLDIGQGDSIYIAAPNGNSLLVDSGPAGGQVNKKINETGKNIFDNFIDVILATHPDADHVGGFQEVLQHWSAGLFVEDGLRGDTATYKNLVAEVDAQKIPHIVARRGLNIVLDRERNIIFHVLYPDNSFYTYRYDECQAANAKHKRLHKPGGLKKCKNVFQLETNEMSIVGKLTYGNTSFILTGDAPQDVEDFLIHEFQDDGLHSDVLKVGHHGSKYSSSDEFLAVVSPHYAAISVGAKNRYGHPAERVLETLAAASSSPEILRTDKMGTIRFISDGKSVHVVH